jgi:hypothetical protein
MNVGHNMRSLLAGVTPAHIKREPFPHIVIPDAMDPALYDQLAGSFPPFSRIAWSDLRDKLPNNRRYLMMAKLIMEAPDLPTCWKDFVGLHSSREFLAEVAALFEGEWHPDLLKTLDGDLTAHQTDRLDLRLIAENRPRISQDARIEINTPVRDTPSSVRGPHLDTPNRLYSGLFYMRAPEDDSIGGDLVLYRWRDGPKGDVNAYILPPDSVEEVVHVPYRANQLVLFPQGISALHGVSARHPTPHMRRYVFITAELDQDWLTVPHAATAGPALEGAGS